MSKPWLILAQLPLQPPVSKASSFQVMDLFLVLGIILVLGLGIVAWLLIVRGPKSDISPARRVYKGHSSTDEEDEQNEHSSSRRRKKRKSRRREHRGRNPTLAETGGLPPPRGPEAPLIP